MQRSIARCCQASLQSVGRICYAMDSAARAVIVFLLGRAEVSWQTCHLAHAPYMYMLRRYVHKYTAFVQAHVL